jgi:hypothetical protein
MVIAAELPHQEVVQLGPVQLEPALLELAGPMGRRTLEPRHASACRVNARRRATIVAGHFVTTLLA